MLKNLKRLFCGDIGLVVLSGLGSRRTHPIGAEGATMARRAPFPTSGIPSSVVNRSRKLDLSKVLPCIPGKVGHLCSAVFQVVVL